MSAKIIAFPGGERAVEQPATTPDEDDSFANWYEQNIVPLANDLAALEELAMEPDRTSFWSYARSMRELLNTWPIPEDPA